MSDIQLRSPPRQAGRRPLHAARTNRAAAAREAAPPRRSLAARAWPRTDCPATAGCILPDDVANAPGAGGGPNTCTPDLRCRCRCLTTSGGGVTLGEPRPDVLKCRMYCMAASVAGCWGAAAGEGTAKEVPGGRDRPLQPLYQPGSGGAASPPSAGPSHPACAGVGTWGSGGCAGPCRGRQRRRHWQPQRTPPP